MSWATRTAEPLRSGTSSVTSPNAVTNDQLERRGDSRLDRRVGRRLAPWSGRSDYPRPGRSIQAYRSAVRGGPGHIWSKPFGAEWHSMRRSGRARRPTRGIRLASLDPETQAAARFCRRSANNLYRAAGGAIADSAPSSSSGCWARWWSRSWWSPGHAPSRPSSRPGGCPEGSATARWGELPSLHEGTHGGQPAQVELACPGRQSMKALVNLPVGS